MNKKTCLVVSNSLQADGQQPARDSSVHRDSSGRNTGMNGLPCPPPGDFPNPRIKPRSPGLQMAQSDSLPTEPPGKPHLYSTESLM